MKMKQVGSNMTEITMYGITMLMSYETPVAYYDSETYKYYRTAKKWSNTTSKHINKWLDGVKAIETPQAAIDSLFAGVAPDENC